MNEEKLIETVKRYPFLYDLSDSRYSNTEIRSNAWTEIGEDMGESAEDCKTCWRKLRENYRKAMVLRKTKSGQSAKKFRSWRFEKEMSFLKDHFQDRQTVSNVEESSSSRDSPDGSPLHDSPRRREYEEEDDYIDDDVEGVHDDGRLNQRESRISTRGPAVNANDRVSKSTKVPKPPKDVASVLMQYLNNKSQKNQTEEKRTDRKAPPEAQHGPSQRQSPLTNFFLAMAQTVETLPRKYQVEVKSKVFGIVSEYEARALESLTGDHQNQPGAPYQNDAQRILFELQPNLHRGNDGMDMDAHSYPNSTQETSSRTFHQM